MHLDYCNYTRCPSYTSSSIWKGFQRLWFRWYFIKGGSYSPSWLKLELL